MFHAKRLIRRSSFSVDTSGGVKANGGKNIGSFIVTASLCFFFVGFSTGSEAFLFLASLSAALVFFDKEAEGSVNFFRGGRVECFADEELAFSTTGVKGTFFVLGNVVENI